MKKRGILGKVVGAILLVGGISAIFLLSPEKEEEPGEQPIRPIKSLIVQDAFTTPDLCFPGMVRASHEVDLSFEVGGRLIEFPVVKSKIVKKGELVGKLDPHDFENSVKNARAELDRTRSTLGRMEKAVKSNAISREEYSRAKADFDKAAAVLSIKEKALENTSLAAPFSGMIANTYVDQFDVVTASQKVLTLQDISTIKIEVALPENFVIKYPRKTDPGKLFYAVFDALKDRKFPVTFNEFETEADPKTQTYLASFEMETPKAFTLLPGMSATLVLAGSPLKDKSGEAVLSIPSDTIAFDSTGKAYVWVLVPAGKGIFTASKRPLVTGRRNGTSVAVSSGLKKGERIAAAGVSLLTEGRKVRLLDERNATRETK